MEATTEDWARLGEALKRRRIERGHPKRAPFAAEIGVNDSTLAIAEGARKGIVSDEMLDFIASKLGWTPATWRDILRGTTRPLDDSGAVTERAAVERELLTHLNPRLAEFNDSDLIREIQTRMLLMANRLGGKALEWRIDAEGYAELVSRVTGTVASGQ